MTSDAMAPLPPRDVLLRIRKLAGLRAFFLITPPSVHGMVVKLEELGLITREPGVARSVRVAVPAELLPELEDVAGPPW